MTTDPRPHTPPHHGKSLAEKAWDRLDELIDQVKGTSQLPVEEWVPIAEVRGRANEMASMVMLMCLPHYKTARDVLVEANKRWKIRQKEIPFEPTPGYKYNPPPPGTKYVTPKGTSTKSALPQFPVLAEKKMEGVRLASASGFSADEIAELYGLSVEHVKHLLQK